MSNTEEWKWIEDYECKYQVSNYGRIKSVERRRISIGAGGTLKERILTPHKLRTGYCSITLCKNKTGRKFLIHRLVAEAFLPILEGKTQVNHLNRNKSDNNSINLEWVTHSENQSHRYLLERLSKTKHTSKFTGVAKHKLRWKAMYRHEFIGIFDSEIEASVAVKKFVLDNNIDNRYAKFAI